MQFIVTLDIADTSGRILAPKWESFGPFDSREAAGAAAKTNWRAGDRRRWMVIQLQAPEALPPLHVCDGTCDPGNCEAQHAAEFGYGH